jgi:DnaJ-class molecular chaperone
MEFKDYYAILGVPRNATDKEIKQAYRRLARQYHPDVNPNDKNAEARFREINEAYTVLQDPEKRKRYDELGANWDKVQEGWQNYTSQSPGGYTFHFSTGQGKGIGEFFGSGFSDFFKSFFGGDFGSTFSFGEDVRTEPQNYEISISLEDAFHGAEKTFVIPLSSLCPRCAGRGVLRRTLCPQCQGSGKVLEEKRVQVRIPKGVREGQTLRLRPDGQEVLLKVKFLPHPLFKVSPNGDLSAELPVSYLDCILGGEAEISTLQGKTVVRIPPGTQNGAVLRLRGLGLPSANGKAGDLFVTVKALLPTSPTGEERKLLETLRQIEKNSGRVR